MVNVWLPGVVGVIVMSQKSLNPSIVYGPSNPVLTIENVYGAVPPLAFTVPAHAAFRQIRSGHPSHDSVKVLGFLAIVSAKHSASLFEYA
jgi:hypothetical protein